MNEEEADGFWDEVRADIDADPGAFIDARESYAALEADEAYGWLSAVDAGDASIELASILYAFGIDDPGSIVTEGDNGVVIESGEWVLYVEHDEGGYARVPLGDAEGTLPEWIWDDWYEFADLFDVEWEMEDSG